MHGEGKKMKGSRAKGRGALEEIFEFYALLATGFSLRYWRVRRRGGVAVCLYERYGAYGVNYSAI